MIIFHCLVLFSPYCVIRIMLFFTYLKTLLSLCCYFCVDIYKLDIAMTMLHARMTLNIDLCQKSNMDSKWWDRFFMLVIKRRQKKYIFLIIKFGHVDAILSFCHCVYATQKLSITKIKKNLVTIPYPEKLF